MFKSLTNLLDQPTIEYRRIPGYQTGYPTLDSLLFGISDSDLVLITAKPGQRSSVFMLNLAVEMSRLYPVLMINTVKSALNVAGDLKVVLIADRKANEITEECIPGFKHLTDNIFIENGAHFLDEIEQAIAEFHARFPSNGVVFIDDINNIFLSREIITYPRSIVEGEIAINLKMIALKYDIPLVLLSKLGSSNSNTSKNAPVLSDLDHLTGMRCPFNKILSVYLSGNELDNDGNYLSNQLFIKVLRNDRGDCGIIRLAISETNVFRFIDSQLI